MATSVAAWRCSRRTSSVATPSSIAGPKLQFNLEHPWDQFVSDFLAEQDLESTEFDSALGTIGGGNHFAELQTVEQVLDAGAFKKLGLGKQQLVVLVHSGSRGLGESILRAHVDQHFGNGVEADSFAAEEYLRGHDFAVRWAKANRELIARRFAATLGAEAECLWDGCHNSITVANEVKLVGFTAKVLLRPTVTSS